MKNNLPKFGILFLLSILMGSITLLILLSDYFVATFTGEVAYLLLSSLVPIKSGRLSKAERAEFALTNEDKEILVGLFLGDLYARKYKDSVNACLQFKQGTVHQEYLSHLYDRFRAYCSSEPKVSKLLPHKVTGKIYSSIYFNTYSLPCFNPPVRSKAAPEGRS